MLSFTNTSFYFIHRQLRRVSHLVVGHSFDPSKDIVVITGGTSGLGRELTKVFTAAGARVAVMDLWLPQDASAIPSAQYFQCDVGKASEVLEVYNQICTSVGVPTVLINNAAITNGKNLLALSYQEIENILRVNLLSSFYTIKTFLPAMLSQKRGYIITIGSVLGYMSPAQLSAYGASKSGLVALHESLTYELGPPSLSVTGVKTLLVCPGKMKTSMFEGVCTHWWLLAPELEPRHVAQIVVEALQHGRRGEIKLPFYGNILPVFRALPWPFAELARHVAGMDESMQSYGNPKGKSTITESPKVDTNPIGE